MRLLCVENCKEETGDVIEAWARERGHEFAVWQAYANSKKPPLKSFDFLVVLGGPQMLANIEDYPYLQGEIQLLSQAIAHKKHVLGICLGAQLIGEALGENTQASPQIERGVFPIRLTKAGEKDPLFLGFSKQFPVLQWHSNMAALPKGAVLLASSPACPNQAFRFRDRVYGFQFHLEMTPGIMEKVFAQYAGSEEGKEGLKYWQSKQEVLTADFSPLEEKMRIILDRLSSLGP